MSAVLHSRSEQSTLEAGLAAVLNALPGLQAGGDIVDEGTGEVTSSGSAEARLAELETFAGHLSGAVESVIDTVLHVRNTEMAALVKRVEQLEQSLQLEQTTRELAEVARMYPKERVVVFAGNSYFGDNVKYAWQACKDRAQALGLDCWFLPADSHQEALVHAAGGLCFPNDPDQWTSEHVQVALSAAVVVTSNHLLSSNPYAFALLQGARHIQLWHGVSIKEIGFRNLPPLKWITPSFARVLRTCGRFSCLVGTARDAEHEWRRWFDFERYEPIGYPRVDVLYREPSKDDLINVDLTAYERAGNLLSQGRRVYFYAPTFRDANRGRWVLQAGIDRLAKALEAAGDGLIVNLHPLEHAFLAELSKALPSVTFVKPLTDVYPLLTRTTALVTDYSSIMFDYLHLDRPIVLFRPDHEDYTHRSRKLFDAKLRTLPGPVVNDVQTLISVLQGRDVGQGGRHASARRTLRETLYDRLDGRSSESLIAVIERELAVAMAGPSA